MTMLREITLECPVCGTLFLTMAMDGVAHFRGAVRTSTDFRECADGAEPLRFLVHQCVACGFAGGDEEFAARDLSGDWADALRGSRFVSGSDGGVAGSDKYEAAAQLAERRGDGGRAVADLLLRAAWCCVEERDHEAERYFRRKAAREYERVLAGYDDVPREERARLTYLVGELWRRAGDARRARDWFGRVSGEVTDRVNQCWLVALAAMQRDEPQEWLN